MHVVGVSWCEPDVVSWSGRVEIVDERRVSTAGLTIVEEVSVRSRLAITGDASRGRETTIPSRRIRYPGKVVCSTRATVLAEHC